MSELQIKNRSERDLRSYEVTWAITNKAQKKIWGSNGIRTHDLRDTSAMLYQLSGSINAELWSLVWSRSSASSIYTRYMKRMTRCVYDKDHINENTSESASSIYTHFSWAYIHHCEYLFHFYSLLFFSPLQWLETMKPYFVIDESHLTLSNWSFNERTRPK